MRGPRSGGDGAITRRDAPHCSEVHRVCRFIALRQGKRFRFFDGLFQKGKAPPLSDGASLGNLCRRPGQQERPKANGSGEDLTRSLRPLNCVHYWTLVPRSRFSLHKALMPNECRQSLAAPDRPHLFGDWGKPGEGLGHPSSRSGPSTRAMRKPRTRRGRVDAQEATARSSCPTRCYCGCAACRWAVLSGVLKRRCAVQSCQA
jgi:hypothetical protein